MKSKQRPTPYRPILHVGDRVLVPLVMRKVPAVVIEDRGPLGVGGRQIVRIRYLADLSPFEESEFPAEELERDPNGS